MEKRFFKEKPIFFDEKCPSSQNFAYFCTKIVYLLLRDIHLLLLIDTA